ncbi:hypothetical protein PIB30_057888 [Stylosanthes scabra]|uniref:Aminotransferase-like plant mobile domain-containing protein n=1 Tax=Stylosanthes scabra TaxID=79078 RepID=A0ABU6UJB6_9FABA|nr:hypothetical protein [Stylosanthes scabra]
MARGDQGEAAGCGWRPPAGLGQGRAAGRGQRQLALRNSDINRLSREIHVVGALDFQVPHLLELRRGSVVSGGGLRHTPFIFRGGGDHHVTGCRLPPWSPHRWRPCWRVCERFQQWYGRPNWGMVEDLLGARPPLRGGGKNEYAAIKATWLRDHVRHTPAGGSPDVLRHDRATTDIAGCAPLMMFWIYQRFPQWCPAQRNVVTFPLAARLNGLQQENQDKHETQMITARLDLDRLGLAQFACTPYDDPAWDALQPAWMLTVEEQQTWRAVVPIVCFVYVRIHHVDRVK